MSLRWRLLRFLRASEEDVSLPSLGPGPLLPARLSGEEGESATARLAAAALRATDADGGPGLRALAQPRGAVEVLARAPRPARTVLPAHERHAVGVAVAGDAVLTLGADDRAATLKTWAFAAAAAARDGGVGGGGGGGGAPALACTSVLRFAPEDVPTALAARLDAGAARAFQAEAVAVGFADGSVALLRGDFLRERVTRARVAPAPAELGAPTPVVALAFAGPALFVVTAGSVAAVDARTGRRTVLDTRGAARAAHVALLPGSGQLCVAREEALYFFTAEGRGPCLAFPTRGADGFVGAVGKYVLHGAGAGEVVAYDVANKALAYRGPGDVRCIFQEGPAAAVICMKDGGVRRLEEIPLRDRVSILLDRGLYPAAVALARSEGERKGEGAASELLTHALRQYAEHLITKDEFDAAAAQLVHTIPGNVEPSWVITRLVEQPGLRSGLRLYLDALHAAGRAAFVHTKVLVTCYRHDRARAAVLPKTSPSATATTDDEHLISVLTDVAWSEREVDTAIELCREAGLFRVAKSVAQKRGRYLALANTLVEDLDDLPGVISLLNATIEETQVLEVLRVSARKLLGRVPGPFVEFLSTAICKSSARARQGEEPVIKLSEFSPVFADRPRWHAIFLERVLARPGGLPRADVPGAWLQLFEALVCVDVAERVTAKGDLAENLDAGAMSDSEELQTAATSGPTGRARPSVFGPRLGRRALKILQSRRSMIDLRAATRICELHGHDTCLAYLYEHLRMYRELGVCLRQTGDGAALLRVARRHGERAPELWVEALRVFAPRACAEEQAATEEDGYGTESSLSDAPARARGESLTRAGESRLGSDSTRTERTAVDVLHEVLAALERSGGLSPVEVIDAAVEASPLAPTALLGGYLAQTIGALSRQAIQEEHAAMRLELDLRDLREEASRLAEQAVVVKPGACSACEDPVSVPMIHFFCGHSFHASCLAPSALSPLRATEQSASLELGGAAGMWVEECPRCAPEQDAAVSMRQAIEEKNVKHDEFFAQLKSSRDGFATVLEYLQRSPFI